MSRLRTLGRLAVVAAALLIVLTALPAQAFDADARPLPPIFAPGGVSNAEWLQRWMNWYLTAPVSSPLPPCGAVDPTGTMYFPTPGNFGTFTQDCPMTLGKSFYLVPAMSYYKGLPPGETRADGDAYLDAMMAQTRVEVVLDGKPVQRIERYKVASPWYYLTMPDDNMFGVPGGTVIESRVKGYAVSLAPLLPGKHVIKVKVWINDELVFDMTDNRTVSLG